MCIMMKTRLNGTERPEMDAGLRRGVAAAAVLLIVCVLAVGVVSADEVTVSSFDGLMDAITNAPSDRTIVVASDIAVSGSDAIPAITTNITLTTNNANYKIYRTEANTSSLTGMFIIQDGGKLTIRGNSTHDTNLTLDGAAISGNMQPLVRVENGGTFTLADGGILTNNTARDGGGVYLNGGTFTMSGGEISKNKASNCGGGVYLNGEFTMESGTISDNTASNSGGGVYVNDGMFMMSDGEISGNNAEILGGGVNMHSGTFTMSGGEISNNMAKNNGGGGVYGTGGSTFTMERGTISGNEAYHGGGVYLNDGTFTMKTGEISGNMAKDNGGGVYLNGGTFTMSGGTISNNKANGDGGGVYVSYDGEFEMSSGTISDNTASSIGDGVYVSGIFELLGSSSVDSVYLTSEKVINVTAALTTTQVTGIELESPADGTEVVTGRLQESDISKFELDSSVTEYELEYQSPDSIVLKLLPYCQVTFDANGGNPTSTMPFTRGEPISPPANLPTRDGYTLTGWYKEEECINQWDFTTPVTSDITLYAGWKKDEPQPSPSYSSGDGNMENAYRVLFNDGATTLYVVTDLSAGDKLTKPEDPVKDGYTFAGWHKDTACTQPWDFETGIPGDMTLYAKWTAIEATPTATGTATATAVTTPQPTATQTAAATTSVPEATTAAAVSPTLVQTPAPVAGALLGLLAAGLLLRRRLQ